MTGATERAQAGLWRALAARLGPATLLAARSRDWASATFEGARHRLTVRLDGADAALRAAAALATLDEDDLPMPGGFVADLTVIRAQAAEAPVLAIEALTIRDPDAAALPAISGARRAG
ncbi:hypothetical protein [Sphingomonas morindae]|uniref:Uncharacterized protein n=1 Tax=Sphingomonas morindae TaxID=1541170 RepID=A0ABY4X8Y4_9SPHN|nr:hypothetical protein [Sphingomonas morindae]USI73376.1 hypothetical protein LHA26_02515 [Sphingomonas morindae]